MTQQKSLNRNSLLINRSFRRYLLPGILMMMSLQLGNVVDMIFVGSLLGADALAGIQLLIPVILLSQICGSLLGMGGSVLAGEYMGKRDTQSANAVYTLVLSICMVVSLAVCLLLFIFCTPLTLRLAGNTGLETYLDQYLLYFLPCIVLINCLYPLCLFLNVQGRPEVASSYLVLANVINLAADYVLLNFTSIGIGGAALSTMLGYLICLLIFFPKFFSKNNILQYDTKQLVGREAKKHLKRIYSIGSSTLATLLTVPIAVLAMNQMIVGYVGKDALIAYTVCTNVLMLMELILGGVKQTIPSIVPILYGEKDYYGIRSLLKRVFSRSVVLLAVLMIILYVFTDFFAKMYGVTTLAAMEATIWSIRTYAWALPFIMYNHIMCMYYQSIRKPNLSVFCTTLEELVFVIPIAFILVQFLGLQGIIFAMILSPALACLATILLRKAKYGRKKDKSLLPVCREEACIEFSLNDQIEDVSHVTQNMLAFCKARGISPMNGNAIALATEEMVVKAIENTKQTKRKIGIDVVMTVLDDTLLLSIRDDGTPFNPLEYDYAESEDLITDGIHLLLKIASEVTYLRLMGYNSTTIAVKRK